MQLPPTRSTFGAFAVTGPAKPPRDPAVPFRMSKVVLPSMDTAERKAYEQRVWRASLFFTPASFRDSVLAVVTLLALLGLALALVFFRQ